MSSNARGSVRLSRAFGALAAAARLRKSIVTVAGLEIPVIEVEHRVVPPSTDDRLPGEGPWAPQARLAAVREWLAGARWMQ
jgi:hypothetical protein